MSLAGDDGEQGGAVSLGLRSGDGAKGSVVWWSFRGNDGIDLPLLVLAPGAEREKEAIGYCSLPLFAVCTASALTGGDAAASTSDALGVSSALRFSPTRAAGGAPSTRAASPSASIGARARRVMTSMHVFYAPEAHFKRCSPHAANILSMEAPAAAPGRGLIIVLCPPSALRSPLH